MFTSDVSRNGIEIFLLVLIASLSVVLINGYPLLFPDSYGYLGFDPMIGTQSGRTITLDFIARPLYPLLGIWSVIFLQATAFSYLMVVFATQYLTRIRAVEIAVMIIISQLPFYVGFVMADAWLIISVLAFLSLYKEFRWPTLLILAVAITVHGSHLYIFIASSLAALFLFQDRAKVLKNSLLSILLASAFTGGVNVLMEHDRSRELSWSLVGSKILVQMPTAIDRKCAEVSDFLMCAYRDNIQAGASDWCYTDPDCYVWNQQSFFKKVDRLELNAASKELFFFVLLNMPNTFIKAAAADIVNFYGTECSKVSPLLPVKPGIESTLAGAPMHVHGQMIKNPDYERSLQAAGKLHTSQICHIRVAGKLITHTLGALGIALLLILRSWTAAKVGVFCIVVLLANDVLFAALSGNYPRYHDRALFLLTIPALLAIDQLRRKR